MIAAYCFAIQIYCDFSGYTDMARGIARMLGVNLSLNFNLPYLASSLNDFWRRWHMSLSYWLRDYVYIPLGGSRRGLLHQCRNLLITFTFSGLWHGASWSFILWGVFHGLWVVGELMLRRATTYRPPRWVGVLITFHVVVLLWIMFRAQVMSVALDYYANLVASPIGLVSSADRLNGMLLVFYAAPLVAFQLWQYFSGTLAPDARWHSQVTADADDLATQEEAGIDAAGHHLQKFEPEGRDDAVDREVQPELNHVTTPAQTTFERGGLRVVVHGVAMGTVAFLILMLGATGGSQFIYFQF